jgi:hypothetical protein
VQHDDARRRHAPSGIVVRRHVVSLRSTSRTTSRGLVT